MNDDVWAPAIEEERRLAQAQKEFSEQGIRAHFTKEDGHDGWSWTSIEQLAPDGETVLMQIRFLICPLCRAMIAYPPETVDVVASPSLDWPERHIDWHVEMGG